ncbi:MAG TPA: biotin/lipoyl-containing protein [Mycobacteriales bacterium]
MLEAVRDSMVELLSNFSRPPGLLRIRVGDVTVQAEWSNGSADGNPPLAATEPAGPSALPPAVDPTGGPAAPPDQRRYVSAPMVGVFHRSPEPGAPPFVDVGDTVVPGQQVAIVEAMKLMIPVKADTDGVVEQVLKESGEHVQYGERLFAVVPPDGD